MQVGVLGPLTVRIGDRDATPRGQRQRDVLVVLLQRRGRQVPAEVLLDMVWGENAVGLSASAVHTVVARLRRQLGPSAIISDGIGYFLDRGVATDEDDFAELVAAARACTDRGDHHEARRKYRASFTTWRGPEPYADASPELVEADRARLTELRAAATEELVENLLEQPDTAGHAEALELAVAQIATQPLRERPYQLAMLAAYRCHRQAEALAIYQNLLRRLRAELGIEPTKATAQLHSRVLRQDPGLDAHHPARPLPLPPSAGVAGPPVPVSPMIGRAAEMAGLLNALAAGRRLITLIGPGGVGKSRLLAEVGLRYQGPKTVVYTGMSGLLEVGPDELAGAIAIGHFELDPRRTPLESLIASLSDGNWLLLIDEAEWVIDPLAPVLSNILDHCSSVQILLTSRMPLDLAGEMLIRMEPLECPGVDADVQTILATPAVEFLLQRLADRAVTVDAEPTSATLLSKITCRVDGLPLALELAAGQASGRSLADIAVLAETLLDVPAAQRSANLRHRSLRDTIDWSVSRLSPDHRTVFRRLSVFVGRFDLAGARAICGSVDDVEDIVRSLAREALIHVERSSASRLTFRLLRTVRDLSFASLPPDELAVTQALHRRWHAGLCRAGTVDPVEGVLAGTDDYLEALRTALDSRDVSTLADLTLAMAEYWRYSGGQLAGLKWIGRVLDSAALGALDRARVQVQRSALALHHFPDFVLTDTEAAIAVLTAHPDDPLLVLAYVVRSIELSARGQWPDAVQEIDLAVRIARRAAGESLIRALSAQANVHAVSGDDRGARIAVAEVRSLIDESTPRATRIIAYTNIGLALLNLELPLEALQLLEVVRPDVAIVTGQRPPDFFLLCQGWAELGSGAAAAALNTFFASSPTRAPGVADRQGAETYLGVGCALAELGHPDAPGTIAAALELTERVQLVLPPAMSRKVNTAIQQLGSPDASPPSIEPTTSLLDRLDRTLAAVCEQLKSTQHVVA